ncbi:hypothetical protein DYB36_007677 [Aphanomyces astaci]|uniref:Uncharacterized protein n=1 Tax=Aphanomyces astaci TaxID=112090 RepID=A0A397AU81_APHAT|nr:hypothetical protein DYB36_007677 [Aphanomyces astaci]
MDVQPTARDVARGFDDDGVGLDASPRSEHGRVVRDGHHASKVGTSCLIGPGLDTTLVYLSKVGSKCEVSRPFHGMDE